MNASITKDYGQARNMVFLTRAVQPHSFTVTMFRKSTDRGRTSLDRSKRPRIRLAFLGIDFCADPKRPGKPQPKKSTKYESHPKGKNSSNEAPLALCHQTVRSGTQDRPGGWATLEEALVLTPSSGGLQPWKFIVVTDPGMRARLKAASYGQAQIADASHLVVFAAKTNFSEADVDAHLKNVAQIRGLPLEALAPLRGMLVGGIIKALDEAGINAWARNHAYIALGNLLNSAALLGIDACPMEGFDRSQYDEILGLRAQGLASAVIATLGYRLATDKYADAPKVRFPKEELFIHI